MTLDQASKIDRDVRKEVEAISKFQTAMGRSWVRVARLLSCMWEIYSRKAAGRELLGFTDFAPWMADALQPLEKSRATQYLMLKVGRKLISKVPEATLRELGVNGWEDLGIERCRALTRYYETKGRLDRGIIELAVKTPAKDLDEAVAVALYKGAPQHDGGPKKRLELIGPADEIAEVEGLIESCRSYAGEGKWVPDHEVVRFALVELKQVIDESEDRTRRRIGGLDESSGQTT